MLGAGASGPRQFRGRISVVPGGHCSPGWICVPRAPPGPRFDGCCDAAVPAAMETATTAMTTDFRRMNAPHVRGPAICDRARHPGTPHTERGRYLATIPAMRHLARHLAQPPSAGDVIPSFLGV